MKNIKLIEDEKAANVYLQWPDSNVLNKALLSDLTSLMDYLEDESDCTLIIFYNLGIANKPERCHNLDWDLCNKWEKFIRRLEGFAGTSIACIDGLCSYFHCQLALACDLRVATDHSSFQMPEVKEGYLPGMGVFRLAKYTGIGAARHFLFTGCSWSAKKAIAMGILDFQCPLSAFENAIKEVCQMVEPIHPEALMNTRRLLNESFSTSFEEGIGNFLAVQNLCLAKLNQ